jgi:hypothetical protein
LPRIREVAVYQRGCRISEKCGVLERSPRWQLFGTYNRILVTQTAVVRLLELTTHPLNLSHHLVLGRRSTLVHKNRTPKPIYCLLNLQRYPASIHLSLFGKALLNR